MGRVVKSYMDKCTPKPGRLGSRRHRTKDFIFSLYSSASHTIQTWDQLTHCPRGEKKNPHQLFMSLIFTLSGPSHPGGMKTERVAKRPWSFNRHFLLEHSNSFSTLFLATSFYNLGMISNPDSPSKQASEPEISAKHRY